LSFPKIISARIRKMRQNKGFLKYSCFAEILESLAIAMAGDEDVHIHGVPTGAACLARAKSSIPTTPCHTHSAADGGVHASAQY